MSSKSVEEFSDIDIDEIDLEALFIKKFKKFLKNKKTSSEKP